MVPRVADQGGQRVFLHVGAPKTGTTFLQTLLWDFREVLRREHGVLFPGNRYDTHFFAAVDLQGGIFHGDERPETHGAWARVVAQARRHPGTTIISHEVLATATAEQARQAVADLAPAEVHVVYTVRDLARQVPSQWQEDVKHGATESFEQWWEAVSRRDGSRQFGRWFWQAEDVPDVVSRWGDAVGLDRFHLVTVPRGGGPGVLWERFCQVIGLDPASVDVEAAAITNTGLGIPEVEVVRRVNEYLYGVFTPAVHQHVVKGVLAHDTLARHEGSRRLALPEQYLPEVDRLAKESLAALQERGVRIVGDLEDLVPGPPSSRSGHPDSATDAELVETVVWALQELLQRLERERLRHRAREAQLERALTWRVRRVLRPRTRLNALRERWPALAQRVPAVEPDESAASDPDTAA